MGNDKLEIKIQYIALAFIAAILVSLIWFSSCAKPKIEYLPSSGKIIIPSKDLQHYSEENITHMPTFEWDKIKDDACQDMGDFDETNEILDRCEAKLRTCKCE